MRVVHVTAGAGGRLCGSCLHDNALVRALRARGRDAVLLPAYVPTTTDEEDVAERRVVMGGVNVWLQEHVPLFRHTPAFVDGVLDRLLGGRRLLGWLASRTGDTRPEDLGPITVSALEGESGRQRKEVEKLARVLRDEFRPDVVHLSNVLLLGLARRVREQTGAAVVCTLSGEDIFTRRLPSPHRERVGDLLRQRAADVDRFVALNRAFAAHMAPVLGVDAGSIAVVPHGVDPKGFSDLPPDLGARRRARNGAIQVGYLARACPEKGLDVLLRAVALLAATHDVRLVAAGAEIAAERPYLDSCRALAAEFGIADRFEWRGQVDHAGKIAILESVDLFAMPTTFPEAKGIPVLEAFTAGVPVVASDHGCFPEYLGSEEESRRGLLAAPGDPAALHAALLALADDAGLAARMGRDARAFARERHTPDAMAAGHEQVYAEARAARPK